MTSVSLSVVVPAFNEQDNIHSMVTRSYDALVKLFVDFEIILVDDCSTDHTGDIAEQLQRQFEKVRVLHNHRNLGQGASLVVGFKAARCDYVTHNAMDYPFHLDDLSHVLPLLNEADVVAVARDHWLHPTIFRRLLTMTNLLLLRNCFGLRLRDYNFVQIFRREVLQSLEFTARSTGFLTPSLLFQAHRRGYGIKEITLRHWPRERGLARSGRPAVLLRTLRDMLHFWLKQLTWRLQSGKAQGR